jgi:hypothetical protein
MATLTGYQAPGPITPDTAPHMSANVRNAGTLFGSAACDAGLASSEASGARSEGSPVYAADNLIGYRVISFVDDYYFRIHLIPAVIDLGAMLGPADEVFYLWNAWFESKGCSSIDAENGEEVELSGPSAPFTLAPLEEAEYNVVVGMAGTPQFTTVFSFVFAEETASVLISGLRLVLFSHPPKWPILEAVEWETDDISSHNNTPQMAGARVAPKQTFQFECEVLGEQRVSRLDAVLFGRHKYSLGLPLWGEATIHMSDIAAGSETITFETTCADYRTGGVAAIWQNPEAFEAVTISAVNAGSLDLDRPTAQTWSGRKLIMPVRIAFMPDKIEREDVRTDLVRLRAGFLVTDTIRLTGYTPVMMYKGLPVITDPSLLQSGSLSGQYSRDNKVLDPGTGPIKMDSWHLYETIQQARRVHLHNRQAVWNYRLLLHQLAGRLGVVWAPSFRRDLELIDPASAADVNLSIKEIGFADYYGNDNPLRSNLALIRPDGRMVLREITGVVKGDPGQEIVTIDAALGEKVTNKKFKMSFLTLRQLSADRIEISWTGTGRADSATAFIQVAA